MDTGTVLHTLILHIEPSSGRVSRMTLNWYHHHDNPYQRIDWKTLDGAVMLFGPTVGHLRVRSMKRADGTTDWTEFRDHIIEEMPRMALAQKIRFMEQELKDR